MDNRFWAYTFLALLIGIGFFLPQTLVLGKGELNNPEITFTINLFANILLAGAITVFILYTAFIILKKNNKYGDSAGFWNLGEKPSLSFFKRFTYFQIFLLSLMIFGTLFLLGNLYGMQSLTSFKFLPQQFSKIDSLIFTTLIVATSENLMAMSVIFLVFTSLTLLAMKYKMNPSNFRTYYYTITPLVIGAVAVVWHSTAYPTSDIARTTVFFFWVVGSLITIASGSFIPFWVMHMANNFFIDFSRVYSSDLLRATMGLSIVGIVVLYYVIFRGRLLGGNKPT